MNDLFYIREVREGYFLLLIKDTHYCLSTGSLESVLSMVTSYTKRFKTRDRLLRKVRSLEDRGRVSRHWVEEFELWCHENPEEIARYEPLINKAIKEGEDFNKSSSPSGRMKKLVKKRPYVKKVIPEEEEVPIRTFTPKLIRKKKI